MVVRKPSLFLSLTIGAVTAAAAVMATGGSASAQPSPPEPTTPEEMKKEIRSLRTQVQTLRSAIAEAAEYDRLRANALNRALNAVSPGGGEVVPVPKAPEPAPRAQAPAAPSLREPPAARPAGRASGAQGRRVASTSAAEPSAAGLVRGKVQVPGGEPVAYVYVENLRGPAQRGNKVKIEQVNKAFVPGWAVVQRGTTVEFPNNDNIYHNVFSLSSGNSFDLGLYNSGGDAKSHTFDEPGAVDIFCNIHPKMAASVLVVPNRFFSKVRADGSFEISGVPTGRRKVVAWAPGSRLSAEWVEVQPGATAEVTFALEPKSPGHKNKNGQSYGQYE